MAGSLEGTKIHIKGNKKYEKGIEWIDKILPQNAEIMFGKHNPSNKLNVLNLGDCWNNNILFRYAVSNNKEA